MTISTKFKVGQPVWVEVAIGKFIGDIYPEKKWVKARVLSTNDGDTLIKTRAGFVLEAYSDILPRPTILWSIREWFSSLISKK